MASVRYDVRIAKPADEVWAVVVDPARMPEWFEGMEKAEVEGDIRRIQLSVGITLVERIVTSDAELRRFQYAILEGLPEPSHLGTIDVLEDGPEASRVVYGTDVADQYAGIVGPATEAGLKGLKALLES